jgi:3'-5' exoribonuclease
MTKSLFNDQQLLITPLSDLADGQAGDFFALLSGSQAATTKSNKPYRRVTFRDAGREVSFPLWDNSPWFQACQNEWIAGNFYKLRATYRETEYGPQLEIEKIREVTDADRQLGFDPAMCQPQSRFPSEAMFAELLATANEEIEDPALAALVSEILQQHRQVLLNLPAAVSNHHAFIGGYLEHVVSVTRNAVLLADRYLRDYADMQPPLSRDLVVAGAILHDIGKTRELTLTPTGASYTPEGELIGHILSGRDIVREAVQQRPIDREVQLRLEHIIVSHQRLPEWGSPKPPMTPEALIVHFADDLDAKFQMMYATLRDDPHAGPFTSRRNPLQHRIFRQLPEQE